jgi:hypothetical protein
MTSLKQLEANRLNGRKSTGPITPEGKERSRCNAVRHGLTAKTVIGALEDAEHYKSFEAAILADLNPRGALERELALRLASLLWRLRRALAMETGLFDIQADQMNWSVQKCRLGQSGRSPLDRDQVATVPSEQPSQQGFETETVSGELTDSLPESDHGVDLARCFLRLANLPNFAFDRLSRYETMLSRQVAQVLFALDALHRRDPSRRRPRPNIRRL